MIIFDLKWYLTTPTGLLNDKSKSTMGEITVVDDKQILQNVFYQYETECKGELTPIQVQTLHSDMRIGGLSFEQVGYITFLIFQGISVLVRLLM